MTCIISYDRSKIGKRNIKKRMNRKLASVGSKKVHHYVARDAYITRDLKIFYNKAKFTQRE